MSTIGIIRHLTQREKFTIGVLFCINLFNFMDRHCIAGVLLDVQLYFDIRDDVAGLIQTGYVIGYTAAAPIFGYLGDRYSRKYIVIFTLVIWISMGMLNSIVHNFVLFVLTRAMVGIGESGFTVLAPSMLADLVTKGSRSIVFALFYYALPVGTGIGVALSAKINQYMEGEWWWGLRVTPVLNVFCLVLIAFGVDPQRGEKDAADLGGTAAKPTSYIEDLRYLLASRSFLLITAGYTCISFVNAGFSWWGSKSLAFGIMLIEGEHGTPAGNVISTMGMLSIVTGIAGVSIGSGLSKWLRPKYPYVDPIIVACGLLFAVPSITISNYFTPINLIVTMVLFNLGQTGVNFNWAVVMDMLMYVVVPTRRSSAKGIETFVSHILGNTVSTSLVGVISEAVKERNDFTSWHSLKSDNTTKIDYGEVAQNFYGLQYALYGLSLVYILGTLIFFWISYYIVEDKQKAAEQTVEQTKQK